MCGHDALRQQQQQQQLEPDLSCSACSCSLSALCLTPRPLLGVGTRLYSDTENAHYSERVHVFGKLSGNKKADPSESFPVEGLC